MDVVGVNALCPDGWDDSHAEEEEAKELHGGRRCALVDATLR